ncbi:MAG: alpha-glucosidase [Solobacterium sp.]|nr:alpha-glucosidase [Solobacterium sp.]
MKWWQKTVVYELYPKSFQDTTGSGTGDIKGMIKRLGYLKSLGVGAIWLTPVCKSPMVDNGYDIEDYCAIDPSYGTMEDMDLLFAEAKKRNIRIVIDLVFNHTSDQNPWFLESKQSKDNPKADWYIWRDAKEDGSEPTNWRGIFGGSAWTWCEERQQYYLHTFAYQQPDLNWANPDVRKALYDAANFWVNKGAGGFRVDAIPYIKKPEVLKDGEPDGKDGMVSVHDMTVNTKGILDYLHEFKENVTEGHDIFTVGEANGVKASELHEWVGENGVFDMIFEFSHVNLEFKGIETWCKPDPWTIQDLKKALRNSQEATRDNGWYPVFFENHDKPRCTDHYFPEDADKGQCAKLMGTLLYTLRGTPFLYQGQELGYRNVKYDSIQKYNDISSYGQYDLALSEGLSEEEALKAVHRFSRDSARTPMQWNDQENAGFSTGIPWLPVHDDYKTMNVEAEEKDPSSVLVYYQQLAKLRADYAPFTKGDFEEILEEDENIFAYRRNTKDQSIFVLLNFSGKEVSYDCSLTENMQYIFGNDQPKTGVLKPYQACIYVKN